MNEIELTRNRMIDLSRMSYERGIYTFSDFLTLAEQSDLIDVSRAGELYLPHYEIYGGYDDAERVMVRFGTEEDLGYTQPWPISCVRISPLQAKFAEELSHRDVLGSLMNIGIERKLLGDIIISNSLHNIAFVFAEEHIADTICHELTRIRHTSVLTTIIDNPDDFPKPSYAEKNLQVKSERIDLIISHVFNLSRSQTAELFVAGKIFINGRQMSNESHTLLANDIVSVRGFGRFIYKGVTGTTRKGNLNVSISVHI